MIRILSFARNFGDKYDKELMDTATETTKVLELLLQKLRIKGLFKQRKR